MFRKYILFLFQFLEVVPNDNFHISKFEIINKTEILISITNKINTRSYSFKLKNIDISDYNLIIKNISKFYKSYLLKTNLGLNGFKNSFI